MVADKGERNSVQSGKKCQKGKKLYLLMFNCSVLTAFAKTSGVVKKSCSERLTKKKRLRGSDVSVAKNCHRANKFTLETGLE